MQRPTPQLPACLAWDDTWIKDLPVGISGGLPIGAVMMLDAGGDIQFQRRLIEPVASNGNARQEQYAPAGQQRPTSRDQAVQYAGPVENQNPPGGLTGVKRSFFNDMQKALAAPVDHKQSIIGVPDDRMIRPNFGSDVVRSLSSRQDAFENPMNPTEEPKRSISTRECDKREDPGDG